jgi:hypothetical protein
MMMDFESETRVGWYKDTTLKWLNSAFVGLFILIFLVSLIRIQACLPLYKYIYNNNHGSTALYGPGPPLSEVKWSAHLSGRQSGDLGEKCP